MRTSLLMSAALLGLMSGTASAQNALGSAQNPPAPGASSQSPQPANSAPAGSVAAPMVTPGANLGTGPGTAAAPMPATRPAQAYGRPARPPRPGPQQTRDDSTDPNAPPTAAYRGGAGSPYSAQASNTSPANTRSVIAPRLPDPSAGASTPEALLASAQRSLQQGRTGAAQEALERAETRILSRTTDPSMADTPDQAAMARHISEARRALGNRNTRDAQAAISAALASPVPPRGPTVTTTYPGGAPMPQPGYAPMPPAGYAPAPGYPPPPGVPPAPGYTAPRTY